MERKIKIWAAVDKVTILLFLLLVLIGWLNIYSAVYNEEQRKIFDFSQRYGKQMVWIITTFLLAFAVLNIDSRFYFFFGYFTENLGFYIKTKDSDDLTFSEKLEWMRFSWKNR